MLHHQARKGQEGGGMATLTLQCMHVLHAATDPAYVYTRLAVAEGQLLHVVNMSIPPAA